MKTDLKTYLEQNINKSFETNKSPFAYQEIELVDDLRDSAREVGRKIGSAVKNRVDDARVALQDYSDISKMQKASDVREKKQNKILKKIGQTPELKTLYEQLKSAIAAVDKLKDETFVASDRELDMDQFNQEMAPLKNEETKLKREFKKAIMSFSDEEQETLFNMIRGLRAIKA